MRGWSKVKGGWRPFEDQGKQDAVVEILHPQRARVQDDWVWVGCGFAWGAEVEKKADGFWLRQDAVVEILHPQRARVQDGGFGLGAWG